MRAARAAATAATALALAAGGAAAQRDTTVVAGKEYAAGGLRKRMVGSSYRDLWTAPVRVPVLDPSTFAGGLTPTEEGGGNQTRSLRFRGADGREYAFRSVNKEQQRALPRDIQGTFTGRLLQDQVSSIVPGSHPVVAVLEEAAGLLHAPPRMMVMADHPALGEFRAEYAGMLGYLEERPDEDSAVPFAGAADIVDTDDMVEEAQASPAHRIAREEYLRSRLLDILIGDWDRHEDQYRWARFDTRDGGHVWRPIPRDRDYAFVDYDGLLIDVARKRISKAVRFGERYPSNFVAYLLNPRFMDRRLLGNLSREAWDSVARDLQARLGDDDIDRAVAALPAEYRALRGEQLRRILRARRDSLPQAARLFYRHAAEEPEVHATDVDDRVVITRNADATVDVAFFRLHDGEPEAAPYFHRVYYPRETREVRVFMHGGNDRLRVHGPGRSMTVRVIGGPGNDRFEDESRGKTVFYDHEGSDDFREGRHTTVSTRPYTPPEVTRGAFRGSAGYRDWGRTTSLFRTYVGTRPRVGVVVGGGPFFQRYGFRKEPYARRTNLRVLYAPLANRWGVELDATRYRTASPDHFRLIARATEMEQERFYGYGNDAPLREGADTRVWHRSVVVEPTWNLFLSRRTMLSLGPIARWHDPEVEPGDLLAELQPTGTEAFGAAGGQARVQFDRRDRVGLPRHGSVLRAGVEAYPYFSEGGDYFVADGELTTFLSLKGERTPTLMLRGGGRRLWGDFPFQDAAHIGGVRQVRGYRSQRFLGDASAYGTVELRQVVTRANAFFVKGDLGVFGLADAGRVWMDGDSPGGWHTAWGGGVFFSFLDGTKVVSASYARGEQGRIYLRFGL
jgi:hypothetical protein